MSKRCSKKSEECLESLRRRRSTEWYWSEEGGKLNRVNPCTLRIALRAGQPWATPLCRLRLECPIERGIAGPVRFEQGAHHASASSSCFRSVPVPTKCD